MPAEPWRQWLQAASGSSEWQSRRLQSLWGGYGEIRRLTREAAKPASVILKSIEPPPSPVDSAGAFAHRRKLRSYEVEAHWYADYSERCGDSCRVARCYASGRSAQGSWLLLEDLDASGFACRREFADRRSVTTGLRWLAGFHATFLGSDPAGLWPRGSYWHLQTRPYEFQSMPDGELKQYAARIDSRLREARFQTLLHGDAKLENFCFRADCAQVAAVDFQYVGGGCGMLDVAYFLDSCRQGQAGESADEAYLGVYFSALAKALARQVSESDFAALEQEWRVLYPLARLDFARFMLGWAPPQRSLTTQSERQLAQVLALLR